MTANEQQQFATSVFMAMATEKQDRLSRGLIRRQAMHDSIRRGEEPSGYRPEWLRSQSLAVVQGLVKVAEAFDREHPDDKCSVSDLMDILSTALSMFQDAQS